MALCLAESAASRLCCAGVAGEPAISSKRIRRASATLFRRQCTSLYSGFLYSQRSFSVIVMVFLFLMPTPRRAWDIFIYRLRQRALRYSWRNPGRQIGLLPMLTFDSVVLANVWPYSHPIA